MYSHRTAIALLTWDNIEAGTPSSDVLATDIFATLRVYGFIT